MPLLDGSHSSATPQPITWKFYTELHAGLLLGASLPPPSSLLLLEAQLPPLKLTLEHQALSSFKRALRLPSDFYSHYILATRNVPCGLKKKPSWRSFCSSTTQPLPSPSEILIMRPPFPPWTATHFTVSPFIPDCTGSSTAQLQSASSRLSSLPLLISKYGLTVRICPVPFWFRWCWSVCHMLQMQHIQFPVLFHWSNCLQLHS